MEENLFWTCFCETGAPWAYLLYRAEQPETGGME